MKKIGMLAVCCMLAGMLIACGEKKDNAKEKQKEETQTSTEKDTENLDAIVEDWNQAEGGMTSSDGTDASDNKTDGTTTGNTITDSTTTGSATTPSVGEDENQKEDTGSAVTSDGWTKDY